MTAPHGIGGTQPGVMVNGFGPRFPLGRRQFANAEATNNAAVQRAADARLANPPRPLNELYPKPSR